MNGEKIDVNIKRIKLELFRQLVTCENCKTFTGYRGKVNNKCVKAIEKVNLKYEGIDAFNEFYIVANECELFDIRSVGKP